MFWEINSFDVHSLSNGLDFSVIMGLWPISIVSWFISSIVGGGSSLLLMPVVGVYLGATAIAPVITTGSILGNLERGFIYRNQINWQVIGWEAPGAIFGSVIGAFILTKINAQWISIFLALFLIISSVDYFRKNFNSTKTEVRSLTVKAWYFLPAGFIYAILSGILGGLGPLLAPFYLGFGLQKEELLATKATARLIIHLVKLFSYAMFGILTVQYLVYGLMIGFAALPGNWLGHIALQNISEYRFRQLVMIFVMFSGLFMMWQDVTSLLLKT